MRRVDFYGCVSTSCHNRAAEGLCFPPMELKGLLGFLLKFLKAMALDARHHAFLQSLMSRGPQPAHAAKRMFQQLFKAQNAKVDEEFFEFVGAYNKKLDLFQLEIRGSMNQYDGNMHYGLVNKLANEQARLGTHYSYAQIAYFKALVEAIVQDPSGKGQLSSIEALNLRVDHSGEQASQDPSTSQIPAGSKLSLAQRDRTLTELSSDKWLDRRNDGFIALGVKSFLELRSIFKNLDIPFCDVCNEAGIKATRCQNEGCAVRIHTYCAQVKFERPEVPRNCPSCGTSWDYDGLDLVHASKPSKAVKAEPSPSVRQAPKRTRSQRCH